MNVKRIAAVALVSVGLCGCPDDDVIKAPFVDNFNRAELGPQWLNTGANYHIVDGKLNVKGAYNHPLWLKKRLPRDAIIEVDVMSKSKVGDIKVEAWGDGQSHATRKGAYMATSYVFILGGWHNQIAALCRMDEHSPDRKTRRDHPVVVGKTYHWKIKRKGSKVEWFVDGKPFLSWDDKDPLTGSNHSYFGFNNWESDLYFDNLKITPIK